MNDVQTMSWDALPVELKISVFEYLDFRALMALRATNCDNRVVVDDWLNATRLYGLIKRAVNQKDGVTLPYLTQYHGFCQLSGYHLRFGNLNDQFQAALFLLGCGINNAEVTHQQIDKAAELLTSAFDYLPNDPVIKQLRRVIDSFAKDVDLRKNSCSQLTFL